MEVKIQIFFDENALKKDLGKPTSAESTECPGKIHRMHANIRFF